MPTVSKPADLIKRELRKQYMREYGKANRERLRAYRTEWARVNADKEQAYKEKNRRTHRERYLQEQRARHHANREQCNQISRDWYAAHRERAAAKNKERYTAYRLLHPARTPQTPEQRKAAHKACSLRRADKIKAWQKRYREQNGDALKETYKKWYASLPDERKARLVVAAAAWAKANPERSKASRNLINAIRRAGKRGLTKTERKEVVAFYEWVRTAEEILCEYCGEAVPTHLREVDHAVPLGGGKGGRHVRENLVCACRRCNRSKHTKTPDEFRLWVRTTLPSSQKCTS